MDVVVGCVPGRNVEGLLTDMRMCVAAIAHGDAMPEAV